MLVKVRKSNYELIEEYNQGMIDMPEDEPMLIQNFPHGFITEYIDAKRFSCLTSLTPFFISAQTQSGKTYAVKSYVREIKKKDKRALFLCSRRTLKLEVVKDMLEEEQHAADKLDAENLLLLNLRNDMDVVLYQEVETFLNNPLNESRFDSYGVIIFDECHFFLADAEFNVFTEKIFVDLLRKFVNVPRIYLTATPQVCFDSIFSYELDHCNIKKIFYYNFARDYSYVRMNFFVEFDDIIDFLRNGKKTLVLVESKEIGSSLEKSLEDHNAVFIDKNSAKTTHADEISNIIQKKQFIHNIVIVTKFLDVGVNVWDSELNNVVLMTEDPITAVQALGRKRVKIDSNGNFEEKINLYFQLPSLEKLNRKRNNIKLLLDEFDKNMAYLKTGCLSADKLPAGFYIDKSELKYNSFFRKQLMARLDNLNNIVAALSQSEGTELLELFFASWLGLGYEQTQKINQIDELVEATKLHKYLEEWLGKELDVELYDKFRHGIKGILEEIGYNYKPTNPNNDLGINMINKNINCIGFKLVNIGKNGRSYIVEKIVPTKEEG